MKTMKRSFNILIPAACILFLAVSCKKETLMTYAAADNIYFNYTYQVPSGPLYFVDSTNITFAFSPDAQKDSVIRIPVAVTGTASNADRTFSVTVDPGSTATAGTDYVLPDNFIVHAGRITDTMLVKLNRTAALKTNTLFFMLRLKETTDFKTQLTYRSRSPYDLTNIAAGDTTAMQTFKVLVSDQLQAGPYWDSYSYYFGDFSEKKVRLMNEIVGMPLDFWSVDLYSSNQQKANALYYAGFTYRYLTDQAYAGKTVFEADGVTPMTMGYYFQ